MSEASESIRVSLIIWSKVDYYFARRSTEIKLIYDDETLTLHLYVVLIDHMWSLLAVVPCVISHSSAIGLGQLGDCQALVLLRVSKPWFRAACTL